MSFYLIEIIKVIILGMVEGFIERSEKRGFIFVGPVIICSFMQAIGMANGNIRTCQTNIILP